MRTITLALAALLAACGGGTEAPVSTPVPVVPIPQKTDVVVFIGDSITARWDLSTVYPGAINAGIGGQKSCEMAARFQTDVLARSPTVVVILAGINDISLEAAPTPACIYDMVQRAQSINAQVIVGTLLPTEHWEGTQRTNVDGAAQVRQFNAELRTARVSYGYTLADYYPALLDATGAQDQSLFVDGVHPNDAGYTRMKAVLVPLLPHAR